MDGSRPSDLSGAAELAETAARLPPSALRSLALGLLARESGRIGEARTLLGDAVTRARAGGDAAMMERAGIAARDLVRADQRGTGSGGGDRGRRPGGRPRSGRRCADHEGHRPVAGRGPLGALALLDTARLSRDGAAWEAELLATRGAIRLYAGQLPLALTDFDRAIGLVHLWRPSSSQSRIYLMRSMARYWSGDWDGAAVDAAASRALAEGRAEAWSVPSAYAVSADVPVGRGRVERGQRAPQGGQGRAWRGWRPMDNVDAVAGREAALLLARQDYARVLAVLTPLRGEEHLSLLASFRPYRWVMPAWILACLGLGRHADAEQSIASTR